MARLKMKVVKEGPLERIYESLLANPSRVKDPERAAMHQYEMARNHFADGLTIKGLDCEEEAERILTEAGYKIT